MRPSTVSKGYTKRLDSAVNATKNEQSFHQASAISRIPLSTLHRAAKRQNQRPRPPQGRLTCLSSDEELLLVSFLSRYSDRGIPLNRVHLAEAVAVLTSHMDSRRRSKLPFKNRRPGRKFLQAFQRRHKGKLIFTRPTRQEAVRFAVCNEETLTTHFPTLEKIIQENNIDASRVWNLDESGATPGKVVNGSSACKRLMRRNGTRDMKIARLKRYQSNHDALY